MGLLGRPGLELRRRKRSAPVVRANAIVLAILTGCTNLDGLTQAPVDGGGDDTPIDAQSPLEDASPVQPPPADGAPSDVTTTLDSPPNGDAGDAGSWCAQQAPAPTFCTDFDTSLVAGFTSVNQVNTGVLAFDSTHFASPPHSAQASTGAVSATSQASLYYQAGVTGTKVHLEYQLRVGTIDPNASIKSGGFTVSGGRGVYSVFIILRATGANLEESATNDAGAPIFLDTALARGPTAGQFERVQLDVVLPSNGGAPPTASVHIGQDLVLDRKGLFQQGASGSVTMGIGIELFPTAPLGPCQIDVDNLLLDIRP
jgi:hypothetical protein